MVVGGIKAPKVVVLERNQCDTVNGRPFQGAL